jgi:hypothetical protein
VQTNDWWTGTGLQWYVDQNNSGWAFSWNDGVIRTHGFISEPFFYQFVDFPQSPDQLFPSDFVSGCSIPIALPQMMRFISV